MSRELTPAQRIVAASMREVGGPPGTSLTDLCVRLAQQLGVLVAHPRPARTERGWRTAVQGDIGYPDLTLCGPGGFEVWELKAEGRHLDADQQRWCDTCVAAGITHRVVRPSDWLCRDVERWLRALASHSLPR